MTALTFIAHEVHRRGGQERAAAEVLTRLAREVDLTVIARACELPGVTSRFVRVSAPSRPAILRTTVFARRAHAAARALGNGVVQSIGAASLEADLITAQFCQAAFTARFGGLRGGGGGAARQLWQRFVQSRFVASERRAYRAARLRRVIAVSSGVGRELQEFYGISADRIRVIPNGVDRATFHPVSSNEKRALRERFGLPTDECVALFLGGDWERKGVRDAITAVAGLEDVVLAIVGAGDQEAMRAHAAHVGATAQVHFGGMSREPERWYQAADLLIFPSRYEAFSLVTLEAAASGLPIIAHCINGTEDLVTDGANGYLSEWGPDALRAHLVRVRDDSALRARLSAGAVASAARYDWDRIAAEHLQVIRELSA